MSWRYIVLAGIVATAASGLACAARQTVDHRAASELAWPVDDPRIRLEAVIDLDARADGTGRKLLRWVGAEQEIQVSRFRRPYGVAWDGSDILLTDPDAGRVARIDRRSRIRFSPAGLLTHPIGVASCLGGIIVTDAVEGKIVMLDHELENPRVLAEGLERPTGVACFGDRAYVVETKQHRVVILGHDGIVGEIGTRGAEPGQFNFPTSIAVDGDTLLVGDTLNFRLQRFDPTTGRFVKAFGRIGDAPGEMPRIKDIAVDIGGTIWVSDGYLDRISLFDRDGLLLISFGGRGAEDGQFSFPAGIASNEDGRVVVADSLNRRLQIFSVVSERVATR